jgi:hypothetical protein
MLISRLNSAGGFDLLGMALGLCESAHKLDFKRQFSFLAAGNCAFGGG